MVQEKVENALYIFRDYVLNLINLASLRLNNFVPQNVDFIHTVLRGRQGVLHYFVILFTAKTFHSKVSSLKYFDSHLGSFIYL